MLRLRLLWLFMDFALHLQICLFDARKNLNKTILKRDALCALLGVPVYTLGNACLFVYTFGVPVYSFIRLYVYPEVSGVYSLGGLFIPKCREFGGRSFRFSFKYTNTFFWFRNTNAFFLFEEFFLFFSFKNTNAFFWFRNTKYVFFVRRVFLVFLV